jgi:hypothetical protein
MKNISISNVLSINVGICFEYVELAEDTNTVFNSTGERAPIDGVGEQI